VETIVRGYESLDRAWQRDCSRLRQDHVNVQAHAFHRLARMGLAIATGLAIGLLFVQLRAAWSDVQKTDFQVFYDSGRAWLQGADLYATSARMPNLNPPHFVVAFAALSVLPVQGALAVWLIVNVASAVLASALIFVELRIAASTRNVQIAMTAAGLCTGVLVALETAQITGVLMLLMTLAWSASRRGRWIACGIIVGLIVSVKPFFGCLLLIPMHRSRYRSIAAAIVTAGAALVAGAVLAGPDSVGRWIQTGQLVDWFQHPANASLLGVLARAGERSWMVWCMVALTVVAVSAAGGPRRSLDVDWSVFALVSLLISPLGWNYYLPILAGPIAAVAMLRPQILIASVGFLWPIPLLAVAAPLTRLSLLFAGSLQAWSLIALWISMLTLSRHERHASSVPAEC
jgi:hypothetical protein